MTDRVRNPGGIPLSAGQVQAAIEAAVRREEERFKRLHGRPWVDVLYERASRPGTDPFSDVVAMADMAAMNPERAGYWVPASPKVELTGLVRSMVRLAQRMHDAAWVRPV